MGSKETEIDKLQKLNCDLEKKVIFSLKGQQVLAKTEYRLDRELDRIIRIQEYSREAIHSSNETEIVDLSVELIARAFEIECVAIIFFVENITIPKLMKSFGFKHIPIMREWNSFYELIKDRITQDKPALVNCEDNNKLELFPDIAQVITCPITNNEGTLLGINIGAISRDKALYYDSLNSDIFPSFQMFTRQMGALLNNIRSKEVIENQLIKQTEITEELKKVQKDLEIMNTDLEEKVKERTKELIEKNRILKLIDDNLSKYIPEQLAQAITHGTDVVKPLTERLKLTVFFSDIKNFTELTEYLEAEELSSLLNEYLTEMTEIAHRWGGTVDKFIGDAIMIFFGAPDKRSDKENAVNCVSMAIDMQMRMKELQNKWFNEGIENPLEIRIGISTGISTVGNFGAESRLSYTVIGTQVNIASRLEGLCKPNNIKISHPTWAYIHETIPCTPAEKINVKGIHREIMTYDVLYSLEE